MKNIKVSGRLCAGLFFVYMNDPNAKLKFLEEKEGNIWSSQENVVILQAEREMCQDEMAIY